jgi:hypothetical protein
MRRIDGGLLNGLSPVNGVVRGFYKRILNDPSMKPMSVSAFVTLVKKVFPAPDATAILK